MRRWSSLILLLVMAAAIVVVVLGRPPGVRCISSDQCLGLCEIHAGREQVDLSFRFAPSFIASIPRDGDGHMMGQCVLRRSLRRPCIDYYRIGLEDPVTDLDEAVILVPEC